MTLPNWIQWNKEQGHYVLLDSCICQRCEYVWYSQINTDGSMKLKICPKCKSPLWNVSKSFSHNPSDVIGDKK